MLSAVVDHVYLITKPGDENPRLVEVLQMLEREQLTDMLTIDRHVDRDAVNHVQRVHSAHLNVYRDALHRGYDRVLIFEDDAALQRPVTEDDCWQIGRLLRNPAAQVVLLGYNPLWFHAGQDGKMKTLDTHAYIAKPDFMTFMLQTPTPSKHISLGANDVWFALYPHVFTPWKHPKDMLFIQLGDKNYRNVSSVPAAHSVGIRTVQAANWLWVHGGQDRGLIIVAIFIIVAVILKIAHVF